MVCESNSLLFYLQDTVILLLDALYADRHYSRFYVLETIARVPYFGIFFFIDGIISVQLDKSYFCGTEHSFYCYYHWSAFLSVLHMYESFGWWRRADYLKVHFAESWNELHHLLIMEVLSARILCCSGHHVFA